MHLAYNPYSLLPLMALLVTLILMHRAWRYRTRHIAAAFFMMMSALAWWSLAVVMEHSSVELPAKIFWMKVSYLGITTLPIAWLVFTLQYTKREKWLTQRNIVLFSILSVITLVMVWTNDVHHLMWKDIWLDTSFSPPVNTVTHNIWFWVHATYAYSLILLGTLCLFSLFWHSSGIYRQQVGIMFLAALVPWVGNFLFIAEIRPFSAVDPTPLAFSITGLAFFWGLSRFQLLDIMPIARDTIFTSMVDGVIVLDAQNRIVELNPAAQHIVDRERSEIIGKLYRQVLPIQADLLELKPDMTNTQSVIALGEGQAQRYYIAYISPMGKQQVLSGHLILLHDDTERRKAEVESRKRIRLETELIEQKRAEDESKRNAERLINTLESAIASLATVSEIRDPYTAGHQRNVSRLASAIAEQMGLPTDKVTGVRIAGLVHDIGKMGVPAEILSKPGQLTEIELGLIKTHPKVGWDILKTIDFPWPIAQAVLQHHRRYDDSGYPECERGHEIIIEARILAIADVVEAMASHRPYRPALGIDKALDEISKNRGKLYDPNVVDACLVVFKEKGFTFE